MSKISLQIGRMTVEVESESTKDLIKKVSFFAELPEKCPVCQLELIFTYRNPQENDYYGLRCIGSPSHETTFGEYKKDARELYFKPKESWKEYRAGRHEDESANPNNFGAASEPRAEHERLDGLIKTAYAQTSARVSLDEACQQKFGMKLGELAIAQKREILDALTKRTQ